MRPKRTRTTLRAAKAAKAAAAAAPVAPVVPAVTESPVAPTVPETPVVPTVPETPAPAVRDTAVFEERLGRYYDELKWLYCELYHNDTAAFDYFVNMLRRSWLARKDDLVAQDARRAADPDWYRGRELLGMMLYVNAFAGNLAGVEEKLFNVRK